ncbi:MAG: hypothetical protein ACRCYU_16700 [Nocardioides sp.]
MVNDTLTRGQRARIESWYATRDFVAIGNLGEQVTARLLVGGDYQVLATQDDLMGGVANILERPASENPEDFIVIDPEGRLITVNSKATVSERSSRLTRSGNLTAPAMRKQSAVDYYSLRAGLISPLEGAQTHGQVVKVDLVHLRAQFFEIEDDGRLRPLGAPVDVRHVVKEILEEYLGRVPPPRSEDWM